MEEQMAEQVPNAEQILSQGVPATPEVTPAPEVVIAPEEEKSRLQKRIDQLTAARRSAEEKARLAEERALQLESQIRGRVSPMQQQEQMVGEISKEKWLEWHADDPYAANDYLMELKATQKAQQVVSQIQIQSQHASTIDDVYKAHPELKEVMDGKKTPEESEEYRVYDEVAREMPDARFLAKGPWIVMKEMERRIAERKMVDREKQATEQGATAEANRQVRVGAAHTLSPSAKPPVSTVKPTPEQERIARKLGMSPEEYAANIKAK